MRARSHFYLISFSYVIVKILLTLIVFELFKSFSLKKKMTIVLLFHLIDTLLLELDRIKRLPNFGKKTTTCILKHIIDSNSPNDLNSAHNVEFLFSFKFQLLFI